MTLSVKRSREMARQVKWTDRQVIGTMRPRHGLIRERLPLSLTIYLAALEGRLVQTGPQGFAILAPPRGRKTATKYRALHFLDRHWPLAVQSVPTAAMLLMAVGGAWAGLGILWGLMLILLAVAWVALLQLSWLAVELAGTFRIRMEPLQRQAARSMPFGDWSLALCHQPDPALTEDLLRAVMIRYRRIQTDAGSRAGTMVCLLRAVTTEDMRKTIMAATTELRPYGADATDIAFVVSTGHPPTNDSEPIDMLAMVGLYAVGMVLAIVVFVPLVADLEDDVAAAATACPTTPSTYPLALRYLVQRLLFRDPANIAPATATVTAIGGLFSLLSLVGLGMLIAGAVQARARYKQTSERFTLAVAKLQELRKVLVVVTDSASRDAVMAAAAQRLGVLATPLPMGQHTLFQFEATGDIRLTLVQSSPGTLSPSGSTLTAAELIRLTKPDYVIGVGTATGLGHLAQAEGAVVVAQQLRVVGHDLHVDERLREDLSGDHVHPSVLLLDRCHAATVGWKGIIHAGPILSANLPMSTEGRRADALRAHPDAIAAETDGAGIYVAAQKAGVDWILIKSIGQSSTPAADFVVAMVQTTL